MADAELALGRSRTGRGSLGGREYSSWLRGPHGRGLGLAHVAERSVGGRVLGRVVEGRPGVLESAPGWLLGGGQDLVRRRQGEAALGGRQCVPSLDLRLALRQDARADLRAGFLAQILDLVVVLLDRGSVRLLPGARGAQLHFGALLPPGADGARQVLVLHLCLDGLADAVHLLDRGGLLDDLLAAVVRGLLRLPGAVGCSAHRCLCRREVSPEVLHLLACQGLLAR